MNQQQLPELDRNEAEKRAAERVRQRIREELTSGDNPLHDLIRDAVQEEARKVLEPYAVERDAGARRARAMAERLRALETALDLAKNGQGVDMILHHADRILQWSEGKEAPKAD